MTKPIIRIHDIKTDKVIDREMTVAELAEHKIGQELDKQRQAEAEAKATAKSAILDRLGLTAEEAALLFS
jgi:hypothetical protein